MQGSCQDEAGSCSYASFLQRGQVLSLHYFRPQMGDNRFWFKHPSVVPLLRQLMKAAVRCKTLVCFTDPLPSKHDGTNTVPYLYHFLLVCSTIHRSTVQKRCCFSIGFHYWSVLFIRYWTIPFSYKHPIQMHNCTSVLVFPTRYSLQSKLNFVYIVSNSNIIRMFWNMFVSI